MTTPNSQSQQSDSATSSIPGVNINIGALIENEMELQGKVDAENKAYGKLVIGFNKVHTSLNESESNVQRKIAKGFNVVHEAVRKQEKEAKQAHNDALVAYEAKKEPKKLSQTALGRFAETCARMAFEKTGELKAQADSYLEQGKAKFKSNLS